MAQIEQKTKRSPSDLTDEEWSATEPFMPKAGSTDSPRRTDLREVLNAIRYLVRSGCLPFPIEEIADAFRHQAAGKHFGKVCLSL
jgi:hypothetical protein